MSRRRWRMAAGAGRKSSGARRRDTARGRLFAGRGRLFAARGRLFAGRRPNAGFSLVEVLIAMGLGVWLLAGAWAWVWTVTASGAGAAERVEARSSLAYARRVLLADLHAAAGLATTQPQTATSLALAVPVWRQAEGLVAVRWDRTRAVLWRLTSSCHLAEGVELFKVTYLDAQGDEIACGSEPLSQEVVPAVRGIVLEVRVRAGHAIAAGRWSAWFPRSDRP